MIDQSNPFKNLSSDIPASIVVFLVALPLCLGVALASGAPLFSGIIAGAVGGLVVAGYSKSALSVSGPAAGLTTIVFANITNLGSFQAFSMAVVLAGIFQFILGTVRAGTIGNYFPASVIKGMLAAIGLTLVLKQIPHAVGYDKDFEGDEGFFQTDGENTFSEIINAFNSIQPGAVIICLISILILILWESRFLKGRRFLLIVPAPLVVVTVGILLNQIFKTGAMSLYIDTEHLVSLPVASDLKGFFSQFSIPDFSALTNPSVWTAAVTLAIVASLESLLSIDAVDKLDPYKRTTPLNRELKAQGLGNFVSGLIGGLPVTSVIVRSSANVNAGARSKMSSILHGILLILTALLIPSVLNKIPLACLAGILLTVGWKLTKPSVIRSMFRKGYDQFLPFIVTIVAILLTNLLQGILIGIGIGLLFVLRSNFHHALFCVNDGNNYLIRLTRDVSFLNKALLRNTLSKIPDGSNLIIDGARSSFIDKDILETIDDFRESAVTRGINVEFRQSVTALNPTFKS
jgi:MFS superfamily sulfate permease-like transporter